MIEIDREQVARIAALLPSLPEVRPFDFCGKGEGVLYPPRNHPGALHAFFFNATQQFGFWTLEGNRYAQPMVVLAGGIYRKGSDFLFYCTQRALRAHPGFFAPEHLDALRDRELDELFHDDQRRNPLPMWPERRVLIREYARWFLDHPSSPETLVSRANRARKPLSYFLDSLREVPGYRGDPLQKKAMLLALILENRPERFLQVKDPQSAVPVIDYHLQRSALRTGLVRVTDAKLRQHLEARVLIDRKTEEIVRKAVYEAILLLVQQSGLSVAAIDAFFFGNRDRCPEMKQPDCAVCPIRSVCAKDTGLFQPVLRTTAY